MQGAGLQGGLATPEAAGGLARGARCAGRSVADSRGGLAAATRCFAWPGATPGTPAALRRRRAPSRGRPPASSRPTARTAFALDDAPRGWRRSLGLKQAAGPRSPFGLPRSPRARGWSVVAVTGTNGKTSTCLVAVAHREALGRLGGDCGTVGIGEPKAAGDERWPALRAMWTGLTTPDPVTLQGALADFASAATRLRRRGSWIGLAEHRFAGTG